MERRVDALGADLRTKVEWVDALGADLRTKTESLESLRPRTLLHLDTGSGFAKGVSAELILGEPSGDFAYTFDFAEPTTAIAVRWDPVALRCGTIYVDDVTWIDARGQLHELELDRLTTATGKMTGPGAFAFETLYPMIELPIRGDVRSVSICGTWTIDDPNASAWRVDQRMHQSAFAAESLERQLGFALQAYREKDRQLAELWTEIARRSQEVTVPRAS